MMYVRRRVPRRLSAGGPRRLNIFTTKSQQSDKGFTLVELLIVVTVLPLIVGAISLGLISVFSLQSGVSSRLSHTSDAQVVAANFQKDVQGASQLTTSSSSSVSPQCGVGIGTQLLGIEYANDVSTGNPQYVVSYREVPVTNGSTTTNSLERFYCSTSGTSGGLTLTVTSQTTLAYDLVANQGAPTLTCVQGLSTSKCAAASSQWIDAKYFSQVGMTVNDSKGNFTYNLDASPVEATSASTAGSPNSASTATGCNFASPGSGTYASNLCFIDFSSLTGSALAQAQGGGCLEMAVGLPNGYTLYYCISLSGGLVLPWYLPTWTNAFLGNSINGQPFYTGVAGNPALYQRQQGTTSVVTLNNLTVVSPSGVPATGWQLIAVDAESSDGGESIVFNSDVNLTVVPNGEAGQQQPVGNACLNGTQLTGSGTTTVTCTGSHTNDGVNKTGTAMVSALMPTKMKVTLNGGGLEGVALGLLLP